tara:strand:+ start:219 stop:464 length:246 start_codon:yes stop_codon:yes gene_type:complete
MAHNHNIAANFVIQNIEDFNKNYYIYASGGNAGTKKRPGDTASATPDIVLFSRLIPGPATIRGRSTAYTPSMGGDPSNQGD